MKRKLIGSILGLGACVTLAHAQGYVLLNNYAVNYNATTSSFGGAPVMYGVGSGGTLGAKVTSSSDFNLELAYDFGQVTGTAATTQSGPASVLDAGFTESGTTGVIGLNGASAAPGFAIPTANLTTLTGYSSGDVTFEFLAFNGTTYADSTIRGHSSAVTYSGATIATGETPASSLLDADIVSGDFTSFYIVAVPEPTTMALVGLGAAGLMLFRRRKA